LSRKGYGGYGETWVDDLGKARIYNKVGYARSQVSYFSTRWPQSGTPDLVVFTVTESHVLDEAARVEKLKRAKEKKEKRQALAQAKHKREQAQRAFEKAKKNLEALENEVIV
jgi:hypothetical protein